MTRTHSLTQINLRAVLADPNPSVDLRLQSVNSSMESFRTALMHHKNRTIAQITDRRNQKTQEKKKLEDKCQAVKNETEKCKLAEIELLENLSREQEERKDAELAVTALRRQLTSLKERADAVDTEIVRLKAVTKNLTKEREREKKTLDKRASSVYPELQVCEDALSFVIEGISQDNLLFRFACIDASNPAREFSLVLDVSNEDYRVPTSKPLLPSLPALVARLNDTRDLSAFIMQTRQAFVDLVS